MRTLLTAAIAMMILSTAAAQTPDKSKDKTESKAFKIVWKKTVVDPVFRSEGSAIGDINGDGKKDIMVGDFWYEAPDWKPHPIRLDQKDRKSPKDFKKPYDPKNYSHSFAVFSEDLDKDGLVDQIVVGFPGAPCYWYKNPGKEGGLWKEYMIQDNACNETPIYTDLLGVGKKGLILGHKGEMAFFLPGTDATKPWKKIAISGPGKNIPGTHHFAHGLGAGDVNGDGKLDVLCAGGWWEQPLSNAILNPWKFHPLPVPPCADMYAFDVDGDGKNDILSSSAHNTGLWWHQQKPGKGDDPAFATQLLFPLPVTLAKPPADYKFSKDEAEIFDALVKLRASQKKVPWRANAVLCQDARSHAPVAAANTAGKFRPNRAKYDGDIITVAHGVMQGKPAEVARDFLERYDKLKHPGLDVGIGVFDGIGKKHYLILIGDNNNFATPGQTHALHFIDIDGDGQKDLVTGRRYWAHGPNGDDHPADPAFLYWLKAKKDKSGFTTFEPMMVDDDSGIGTQFTVEDINGDGLLDIIVSNKKGVFVFIQDREPIIAPVPPTSDN